eukprot:136514-Prymnesium_polylepis.1
MSCAPNQHCQTAPVQIPHRVPSRQHQGRQGGRMLPQDDRAAGESVEASVRDVRRHFRRDGRP